MNEDGFHLLLGLAKLLEERGVEDVVDDLPVLAGSAAHETWEY
jgi:hypothetical protein